jgi:hypothetical protein
MYRRVKLHENIESHLLETVVSILVNAEMHTWPSFQMCILCGIVSDFGEFKISTKIIRVCASTRTFRSVSLVAESLTSAPLVTFGVAYIFFFVSIHTVVPESGMRSLFSHLEFSVTS